jgi:hypothetical protein
MGLEKPNPWAPTVDGFAEEAFVPASSEQLLRQGQVNTKQNRDLMDLMECHFYPRSPRLYCWNEFLSLYISWEEPLNI